MAWPGLTTAFVHIQRLLRRRGCADERDTAMPHAWGWGTVWDRPCWGRGAEPCPSGGGWLHQHCSTPHLHAPCPAVPVPCPAIPVASCCPSTHATTLPSRPVSRLLSPASPGSALGRFDHVCIFFLPVHLSSLADLAHHFNPLAAEQVSGAISWFVCK